MSRRYRGRHRRRSLRSVVTVALALLALIGATLPGAYGGYLAQITNNSNSAATATYFTCTTAQGGTASQAYFTYPLSEATGLGGAGDISGNGRTGAYSATNVSYGTTNTGTGAVCPRDNLKVVSLSGSTTLPATSGYVSGPNTLVTNPNTFSIEIWFKTSVAQGRIMGFGGSRTGTSSLYDRQLYVDTNGKLVFGVYPNAFRTITSTANVANNAWHHAVGTLGSGGLSLYLDGNLVGSTDTGTTSAQTYNGYWRVGYDNLATWPNAGTSYFFTGSLAFASVYTTVLTAAQVAQHYRAGTT